MWQRAKSCRFEIFVLIGFFEFSVKTICDGFQRSVPTHMPNMVIEVKVFFFSYSKRLVFFRNRIKIPEIPVGFPRLTRPLFSPLPRPPKLYENCMLRRSNSGELWTESTLSSPQFLAWLKVLLENRFPYGDGDASPRPAHPSQFWLRNAALEKPSWNVPLAAGEQVGSFQFRCKW